MIRRFRATPPGRRLALGLTTVLAGLIGALALATGGSAHVDQISSISSMASTLAADPNQINFTLEGCRNNGTITLPDGNGDFICPDAAYTTGNLGKGWNELDLVPHRVTLQNNNGTQTYAFIVAGDYTHSAGDAPNKEGWDAISELTLNTAKSSSCTASVSSGSQTITPSGSGVGGADQTIYRLITITGQTSGSTCVYDYYQRLAIGSHNFSGSSLQSNLWNQSLKSSGIGEKRLSIPVKEILPQELRKDMSASQGFGFNWTLIKETSKANFKFDDTCSNSAADQSTALTVKITWTKSDPQPNGDIKITTHVYAKNPASRSITVTPTDNIYKGNDQSTLIDTKTESPIVIPAATELLVLTHELTIGAADLNADSSYNDVATATYTDTATNIPIPQTTQAVAATTVAPSGQGANGSVTINDTESITPNSGLSFKVASPALGDFVGPSEAGPAAYVADAATVGPVNWSYTANSSGSVTFTKTVTVTGATITSGTLSDSAQIVGDNDQVLAGANGSVAASTALSSDALVSLGISKSIPGGLTTAQSFALDVSGPSSYTNTVNFSFPVGVTSKSATLTGLEPGSYTVHEETPAAGWSPQADQTVNIQPVSGQASSCSASTPFANNFSPPVAKARKVTFPSGSESGWQLTLSGGGVTETKTTTGTGYVLFATALQDNVAYTITETAQNGWNGTGSTGECSFTVHLPANAGHEFACTFTNVRKVRVIKTVSGSPPALAQSFQFQLRSGASTSAAGTILETQSANAGNGGLLTFNSVLQPNTTYALCELVMPGWMTTLGPPFYVVYNPSGDNSTVCADFTVSSTNQLSFSINNTFPGGLARTIGFWKNWASCASSNGGQKPVLDQTLGKGDLTIGILTLHDSNADPNVASDCLAAIRLLNKSTIDSSAKKMSSDPAFNLAAQLVAADLNVQAGAGTCPAAVTALNQAHSLLAAASFNGITYTKSGFNGTLANSLASTLDKYNNSKLC